MKLSIFRATSPDSSANLPTARLVIDCLEGSTVIGWAVGADGMRPAIALMIEGQRCEAVVEPMPRQDVLDALRLSGDALLGFRLHLPPLIWGEKDGKPRGVQIHAAGQQTTVEIPAHVSGLVEAFRQAVRPSEASFIALAWHIHQAGPITGWPKALDDWLRAEVDFRGGWSAIGSLAAYPDARPDGQVERVDRGVVHGWTRLACLEQELVALRCNGEPLDCSVIRVDRADVRQALKSDRRSLGFEIELPSTMWQRTAEDGSVSLSVHVAGRSLGEPIVLQNGDLTSWLDRQRDVEAAVQPDESADQRRERQYATLLVIEHVAAAGLWAALEGRRRDFVTTQAQRYGIAAPPATAVAVPLGSGEQTGDDYATTLVWRLLRSLNNRLNTNLSRPLEALQEVLTEGPSAEGVVQRFLWSAIPYFCGRGHYAALRPYLDAGRLRRLVGSRSAWELSLVLPEAAAGGDFQLAHQAMEKIVDSTGWLNTDCVSAAIDLALRNADPEHEQTIAIAAFVDRFLDLLQSLSNVGYWSRLHDANLIAALVQLLANAARVDETLAYRAEQLALRAYALVPDFWRQVDSVQPPVGGWSLGLQRARSTFEHLREALAQPARIDGEQFDRVALAFAHLRAAGNIDADIAARELALNLAARRTPQTLARKPQGLLHGRNDLLRLLALPSRSVEGGELAADDDLAQEIRDTSDVAPRAKYAAVSAMVRRCFAYPGDGPALMPVESDTVRALTHRSNHFIGVRLACTDWLRGRPTANPRQSAEGLAALCESWKRAFDSCVDLPHPPAALMATASLLDAAMLQEEQDASLTRVVAEMCSLLRQRYGEAISLSNARHCVQPQLANASAGHSTLVAVYSCRRNLPTRIRAIRESWGRNLDALGIPWLVVVGDGDDTLHEGILALAVSDAYDALPAKTLALVDWVWRHTRFEHLLKIDDDCHLAVEAYFAAAPYLAHHYHGRRLHRGVGGTDRVWHQGRSSTERAAKSADKSPEPSTYADGGAAYCLSRHAMAQLVQALQTTSGARLTRSSYLEDKLLGDLLASRGIGLSNEGHYTLIRRRFGAGGMPVNAYDNLFYPSRRSPTLVTHLDGFEDLAAVQAGQLSDSLRPARLWPTHTAARLGGSGTNQLELLSPESRVAELTDAPVLVIAVARNECVLAPHFLQHYRALGVRHFVFVDNLSDDGTREYLAQQPDVVLYSADTEYKHSHFGVSWQQAVLGAHALGKWVVLADLDEFLVYPDYEQQPIERWLGELDAAGHDAARVLMIDMYPQGALDDADFTGRAPFDIAQCHDAEPALRWNLGSGAYSNGTTYLSALRHRLIPDSAPNLYTSQKIAVFRYQPWVRLSEGLHYASNLRPAIQPVWFAHFKYHAGFRRKVETEVARRQHFNDAEEYKKYAAMLAEARSALYEAGVSATYSGSRSWLHLK